MSSSFFLKISCTPAYRFITYRIVGNFHWCKISWKFCIRFRRNFADFIFTLAGCFWVSHFSAESLCQWQIDPVANFPQARHFSTKNSGPAIPVGFVSCCCLYLRKAHQMSKCCAAKLVQWGDPSSSSKVHSQKFSRLYFCIHQQAVKNAKICTTQKFPAMRY